MAVKPTPSRAITIKIIALIILTTKLIRHILVYTQPEEKVGIVA